MLWVKVVSMSESDLGSPRVTREDTPKTGACSNGLEDMATGGGGRGQDRPRDGVCGSDPARE